MELPSGRKMIVRQSRRIHLLSYEILFVEIMAGVDGLSERESSPPLRSRQVEPHPRIDFNLAKS